MKNGWPILFKLWFLPPSRACLGNLTKPFESF
jgi:hypothetical protein